MDTSAYGTRALSGDEIHTGLFFKSTSRPPLEDLEPVLEGPPLARWPPGLTDRADPGDSKKMI